MWGPCNNSRYCLGPHPLSDNSIPTNSLKNTQAINSVTAVCLAFVGLNICQNILQVIYCIYGSYPIPWLSYPMRLKCQALFLRVYFMHYFRRKEHRDFVPIPLRKPGINTVKRQSHIASSVIKPDTCIYRCLELVVTATRLKNKKHNPLYWTRKKYKHRPQCTAKTRTGRRCECRAVYDYTNKRVRNGKCYMHGGLSTGPLTKEGRRKSLSKLTQYRNNPEKLEEKLNKEFGGK